MGKAPTSAKTHEFTTMSPPPKELPGFYFDSDKNRYFPIKGPLPGGADKRPRIRTTSSASTSAKSYHQVPKSGQKVDELTLLAVSQEMQDSKSQMRNGHKVPKLLNLRELHGRIIPGGVHRCEFQQAFQDIQISHPMVWTYEDSADIVDTALEKFNVALQSSEGQRAASILSMGSISGTVRFREIGKVRCDFDSYSMSPLVWPPTLENVGSNILPPSLCNSEASIDLSTRISSINKIGSCSSSQNALVTTLGWALTPAEVYVFNLSGPLELTSAIFYQQRRIKKVGSFNTTLWTAACSPSEKEAAVGLDNGAGLINFETCKFSWILHSKSSIFSQQFDNSGNVILCGLRNGSIVPIDIRQNQQTHIDPSAGPSTRGRQKPTRRAFKPVNNARWNKKRGFELRERFSCSTIASMSSSVSSLAFLPSDDHYFLGSSMDGSIKLFDMRNLQRSVQSHEGHKNSCNHLQLAINPSGTHFVSGGEDCHVRCWNIKTAELLFDKNVSNSIITTVCWPENEGSYKTQHFDANSSWGAWLGSMEGLYYMHGT